MVQGDATITPKTDRSAQYTFRQPGNMTVKLKIQFQPNGPEVEYTAPIRVQPLDVYSVFGVINAPETYAYNTTYRAKYMGTETNVEIVDVEADHRTHYPYYPFDTWSYNKSTRTLSFLIPDHPLTFDYKLIIHYKVKRSGSRRTGHTHRIEFPGYACVSNDGHGNRRIENGQSPIDRTTVQMSGITADGLSE